MLYIFGLKDGERERDYIRLNSVTVSQYVKIYFSPPLGVLEYTFINRRFQHVCIPQMYDHTRKLKSKRLHPALLSPLSEIAGVFCQGVFRKDNLSV